MKYEIVMGLETHVELATESKMFCSCSAKFGGGPNEHVCPACSGMPGMLPIANKKAIDLGIAASLVTNSVIAPVISWEKKNYFYPDLPTAYQNTQLIAPICTNGYVEISTGSGKKRITLKQIHIEEDAGKLVHSHGVSLADYNRAGVPLVEIVTNPDFRSTEEVLAYLEKLNSLLSFAGVSDCKMQEGSMRCDVNISVREMGAKEYGTRTEIKNLNSFKAIAAAIEYESERHIEALEKKTGELVQETRRWDDNLSQTFSMRSKEDAADYRYFPNPDVLPIAISKDWIERIRKDLPEPAEVKYARITGLGANEIDAKIITGSKTLADILDALMARGIPLKDAMSWIITELLSLETEQNKSSEDIEIDVKKFADLICLVNNKEISRATAKKILPLIHSQNIDPVKYVKENNLGMVSDTGLIEEAIKAAIAENPRAAQEYRAGSEKTFGFLMGMVMKKTAGKADPAAIKEMLINALKK